jgi:hypothetical protein
MGRRALRTACVTGIFAIGFVCGSIASRPASADLKDTAGGLMGQAAGAAGDSGGPLGAAVKLGTSITDMQQHLDALNKNLQTLRDVQKALGG